MDYEKHYHYTNIRFVIILLIAVLAFNYFIHPMNLIFKKEAIVQEPINNTIFIYKNITITVTPTPDGITYFAGEYEDGLRKLGRLFSWNRKDVQGKEDMSGHVKVYDYRRFESMHIFNPSDYNYYEVRPNENADYLLIFVKIYLDDVIGGNTPLWLPNESHYYLQSENVVYYPSYWDKQLRIKELEETWNDNNNHRIGYYGVFNAYSRDLQYASTAGEYAESIYWVLGGESNAIDGYILYEIPKKDRLEEIYVLTDMYAFGNPSWRLIR